MSDENVSPGELLDEVRGMMDGLKAKRLALVDGCEKLEEEREQLAVQLAEFNEAIAVMDKLLGPLEQDPPVRASGVKKLVKEVILGLYADVQNPALAIFSHDIITKTCLARDSDMKEHSIGSALGRLTKEGWLDRSGKRGSFMYSSRDWDEKPKEEPVAGDPPGSTSGASNAGPDEVILGKLKDAGNAGCTKKELAWAVGDQVNLDGALDKLVAGGKVKSASSQSDGQLRYCLVETDDVGKPRSLFAGADAP